MTALDQIRSVILRIKGIFLIEQFCIDHCKNPTFQATMMLKG